MTAEEKKAKEFLKSKGYDWKTKKINIYPQHGQIEFMDESIDPFKLLAEFAIYKDAELKEAKENKNNFEYYHNTLLSFLRKQQNLRYIMIYENDFEFADKILKVLGINKQDKEE